MAHPQQLCFIELFSKRAFLDWRGKKILEIGSYFVKGGIRPFFPNSDYIGVDLTAGPGVDLVCSGHLIDHDDKTYDVTVSCECFEHNPYWLETFQNMYRMTLEGGFVVFSCATRGRLEHGTNRTSPQSSPGTQDVGWNYYLNLEQSDFSRYLQLEDLFDEHLFISNKESRTLFFIGKRSGGKGNFNFNEFLHDYKKSQVALEKNLRVAMSPSQRCYTFILNLILLPTRLVIWLPDPYFQNFSVAYVKSLKLLSRAFLYLVRR